MEHRELYFEEGKVSKGTRGRSGAILVSGGDHSVQTAGVGLIVENRWHCEIDSKLFGPHAEHYKNIRRCVIDNHIERTIIRVMEMPINFNKDLQQRISRTGAIAVLIVDDAEAAVPLAEALVEGGIDCMELTLRTPAAFEALQAIKNKVPRMVAGVGTVLTSSQVDQAVEVGADFAVAPGLNRRIVERATQRGLSFAPGVVTPTEIESAIELGCRLIKFFPAEPAGGLGYLKSMAAPYEHLGIRYIPLGGVSRENSTAYLQSPLISAIGGSFIASRQQIRDQDWEGISKSAADTRDLVQSARGE